MKLKLKIEFKAQELDFENIKTSMGYVSQEIQKIEIDKKSNEVILTLGEGADKSAIEAEAAKVLANLKPLTEEDTIKVLHDFTGFEPQNTGDVFEELVKRGDITCYNEGYFALSGKLLGYMKKIDESLFEMAMEMKGEEVVFPITTQISNLNKHDFFKQTPQFANFISTLKEDLGNISNFSKKLGEGEFDFKNHIHTPKCMCRSAVCLNSYPRYEGRVFGEGESITLTAVGKVFRNESKNVQSLERLHEFSMRELIFFGSVDFVEASLKKCVDWCVDFVEKFELKSIIQSANDPFFAENFASLRFYQMAQVSKYEVRLFNPSSGNQVSCASLNNHATHFSKSFDIKFENGEYIFTGCAGWGLERCVFMVLAQHGLDENKWPESLKKFFGA